MKTQKLNKTNLSKNILENHAAIEAFLGKEIESVITMKVGFEGKLYWQKGELNRLSVNSVRPFSMVNKATVDIDNETITVKGRNRWQRQESVKTFKIEKIGYKLETTSISEGWLYGNPQEII